MAYDPLELGWLGAWRARLQAAAVPDDPVGSLTEQAAGHHLTAAGAARPLWRPSGIGGRPGWDFDGADDLALGPAISTFIDPGAFEMFLVVQVDGVLSDFGDGVVYANAMLVGDGDWTGLHVRATGPTLKAWTYDGDFRIASTGLTLGVPMVLHARHEAGQLVVSRDGGAETSVAAANVGDRSMPLKVASGTYSPGTKFVDMTMGDLLVRKAPLTVDERAELIAALTGDYGITRTIVLGRAAELDDASPFAAAKARELAQAQEVDAAQPVEAPSAIVVEVGQATDQHAASAFSIDKRRVVGQAADPATAQPVGRAKARGVAAAGDASSAIAATRRKTREVGQAPDLSAAAPVDARRVHRIGQAHDLQTSQPVEIHKRRVIGQAAETSAALPLSRVLIVEVGQAADQHAAAQLRPRKTRPVGQAVEIDRAGQVTTSRRPAHIAHQAPPGRVAPGSSGRLQPARPARVAPAEPARLDPTAPAHIL